MTLQELIAALTGGERRADAPIVRERQRAPWDESPPPQRFNGDSIQGALRRDPIPRWVMESNALEQRPRPPGPGMPLPRESELPARREMLRRLAIEEGRLQGPPAPQMAMGPGAVLPRNEQPTPFSVLMAEQGGADMPFRNPVQPPSGGGALSNAPFRPDMRGTPGSIPPESLAPPWQDGGIPEDDLDTQLAMARLRASLQLGAERRRRTGGGGGY